MTAGDGDTTVIGRFTGLEFRVLKNKQAREIIGLEQKGEDKKKIDDLSIASLGRAVAEGDQEKGVFLMGQAAALIKEEMPIAHLFRQMTQEAEERLQGLVALMGKETRRSR